MMRQKLFYILILSLNVRANAQGFDSSFFWNESKLLPILKSHFSVTASFRELDTRYDRSGSKKNLGHHLVQRLSSEDGDSQRAFSIKTNSSQWTPSWGFGLSDSWTLLARISVTKINAEINESISTANSVFAKSKSDFNKRSERAPLESGRYETTQIGNFELQTRHALYSDYLKNLLLAMYLKFPSSERTKIDYYVEPSQEPTNLSLGVGFLSMARLDRQKFYVQMKYDANLNDSVYAEDEDGFATEAKVDRNPGDSLQFKTQVAREITDRFSVSLALEQFYKEADIYKNAQVADQHETHSTVGELAVQYISKISQQTDYRLIGSYMPTLMGKNADAFSAWNILLEMQY